jgi:N-acetylglutamate synthase-like GNAT family acetyltransferase
MGLKQIDHGSEEYVQMVQLRDQMLRKPLGLRFTPEELNSEKDEMLIASFDEDEILGCCMLKPIDAETVRLRQMAVKDELQLKGIGASIIAFAENLAKDKGYRRIVMHARDTAIGFYEKFGYEIKGEEFIEVNIPHHIMEKELI